MNKFLTEIRDFLASEALTIVTAFVLVVFLHDQVLEAYPVPTRSMEPTIEGDPTRGDRVIVDKTFDNRTTPQRFDMVVFWREDERKTVVKRVVGLPGEWIRIDERDIFVGPTEDSLARVQKLPGADGDMMARLWDSKVAKGAEKAWFINPRLVEHERDGSYVIRAAKEGEKRLYLPLGRGTHFAHRPGSRNWPLSFRRKITTGYLDGFGKLQDSGLMARDFGVEAWVRAEPVASLWIQLRFGGKSWLLSYRARGNAQMWSLADGSLESVCETKASPLAPAKSRRVVFMYLDGRFCLSVDGEDLFQVDVAPHELASTMNGVALAAGSGRIMIDHFSIIHDFHYSSEGEYGWSATRIPQGQYFVLGDNSPDSSDSRMTGPIREEDLRGRPLMVASPLSRFRIFKR